MFVLFVENVDEEEFTQLKSKPGDGQTSEPINGGNTKPLVLLVLIFLSAIGLLALVYLNFPHLAE